MKKTSVSLLATLVLFSALLGTVLPVGAQETPPPPESSWSITLVDTPTWEINPAPPSQFQFAMGEPPASYHHESQAYEPDMTSHMTMMVASSGFASFWSPDAVYYSAGLKPEDEIRLTAGSGSISGHVYRSNGGTPIVGATIVVYDEELLQSGGPFPVGEALTDGNGHYVVSGLPTGGYVVSAQAAAQSYAGEWYPDTYHVGDATPVPVVDSQETSGIDFTLDPGGTISGQVVSSDGGVPIANLPVFAIPDSSSDQLAASVTDAEGHYILGLPAGSYLVVAYPVFTDLNYVVEWYDGVPDPDSATPVPVSVGQDSGNIDFVLEPGGTISGHIFASNGTTPLAGVQVVAVDYESLSPPGMANSGADGSYTILGLPTGLYDVSAAAAGYLAEWYPDALDWNDAAPVPVTAPADTPNIDFTLEVAGSISGQVTYLDGGTPVPVANLRVHAHDPATDEHVSEANTDSSGNYTISGLPTGSYIVLACTSCSGLNFVKEYYQDALFWREADPVSVTAPADTPNIDFVLDAGGTISGVVRNAGGSAPLANVSVEAGLLLDGPDGKATWVEGTTTDAQGTYTIRVALGDYHLRSPAGGRWGDGDDGLVREFYDEATRDSEANVVTVAEGVNPGNVDFTLEVGGSISGQVTYLDGATPMPVANLSVHAHEPATNDHVSEGRTDSNGNYTIPGLPTGSYVVFACAECSGVNFVNEYYQDALSWQDADSVPVTALADTPGINFTLEVGGSISGQVTYLDGGTPVPVANLSVMAHDPATNWHVSKTHTDSNGNYTIPGLPTGSYIVLACASCSGLDFVSEYYQDARDWRDADPVPVTALADTSGIDFSLEVGGSISGHVYQPDGITPVWGADVEALDHSSLLGRWVGFGQVETAADGSYTFGGLPTGTYGVRVRSSDYVTEWYQDVYFHNEATPVPVTALADTPNIDFVLDVGGTISGVVRNAGGSAPLADASVESEALFDPVRNKWIWAGGTTTDAQGAYTIRVPFGDYRLRAPGGGRWGYGDDGLVQEYYSERVLDDEADVVTVADGVNPENVDFTLEIGGSISGRVTYLDGGTPVPIANLRVNASDDATGQWMTGTNTDSQGYYTLFGLPTGSFRVGTDTCGTDYIGEFYDDEYGWELADPVPVTASQDTAGIDFVLDPVVVRATVGEAIADGVAWLAAQQNPDGSWGTYYQVAKTGLAVLKLETHALDLGYASPFDTQYEYVDRVVAGLDFLFANAYVVGITTQPAGDPDTDGDGIGVYFRSPAFPPDKDHAVDTYDTGIALMALAASTTAGATVSVPGSPVDGWSFATVAQDTVDYLAWGQTDFGSGRGGWNYGPMDARGERSDQSNAGWVTLGLAYAEDFGSTIPGLVRSELDIWINYVQNDVDGDAYDGGAGYTGPFNKSNEPDINILKTGNLLQQMAFVGDTQATPRVQDAIDYLVRYWDDWHHPGWRGCPTNYHTTYAAMKGLEALGISTIDGIDWFAEFAEAILSQQSAGGWWPSSPWDDGERILSVEWALLTLQREVPVTRELPDLVIVDKAEEWIDEGAGTYAVSAVLKNIGNMPIPESNHYVTLFIDGAYAEVQNVPLQGFMPGDTLPLVFSGPFTLSDGDDEVKVCADTNGLNAEYDDRIEELNEDNN